MAQGNHNRPTKGFHTNPEYINRNGQPRLDPLLVKIRELERTELTEKFSEFLRLMIPELKEIVHNPQTCAKDLGIAKAVVKWIETGDFRYIQPYVEYIFGKPTEHHKISGKLENESTLNIGISDESLKVIGEVIVRSKASNSK